MPVRRSRPLSPTGRGEGDAETGHSSRSHTPHAYRSTRRSHRFFLQRMLRGENAPGATFRTPDRIALQGREPPIIDAKANTVEETDSTQLAPAPSHRRACSARCSIAQRKVPGSDREVRLSRPAVPTGPRSRRAQGSSKIPTAIWREAVPTGSSSPAVIRGNRFLLVVMLHGCTQSPEDFAAGTRMNFIAEEPNVLRGLSCTAQRGKPGEMLGTGSRSRPAAGQR